MRNPQSFWREVRQWPIRAQLVGLVLVVVVPIAIATAYGLLEASKRELARAHLDTRRIAAGMVAELNAFLDRTELTLAVIAARPQVKALDPRACDAVVEELGALLAQFENFNIRDTRGGIVCTKIRGPLPASTVANSSWFQEGLRSGGLTVGGPILNPSTGHWVSVPTYPVRDRTGEVAGLLVLGVDLLTLQERVLQDIPEGTDAIVFDREAKFMMRWPDPEQWIGKSARDVNLVKELAKGNFHESNRVRGIEDIAHVYAFQTLPATGWVVAAGVSEDSIFDPQLRQLAFDAMIGLAGLVVAVMLAILTSAAIVRPVRELERISVKVAGGDLAARASVGGPVEIASVAREFNCMLDARREIELELRESQRRYTQMLDNAELVSLMLDSNARIDYCNEFLLRLTGWRRDEVMGRDWFELFVPPEIADELHRVHASLLANQPETWHHENEILTRSGARRLIRWHNSVLRSPTGDPMGTASLGEDITERRQSERELMQRAAELQGLAARLAESEEIERGRLAQELHDQVGSILTALNLNLTIMRGQLPPQAEGTLRQRLDDCIALLDDTIGLVRGIMTNLRPPVLDDYGVAPALRWYAEHLGVHAGFEISVNAPLDSARRPPAVEIALFRIAQEAVNNAMKHSNARHIVISLEDDPSLLRLTVADDGRGFEPAKAHREDGLPHWGLVMMRERAQSIGGRARIDYSPGQGTRVIVEVPT